MGLLCGIGIRCAVLCVGCCSLLWGGFEFHIGTVPFQETGITVTSCAVGFMVWVAYEGLVFNSLHVHHG